MTLGEGAVPSGVRSQGVQLGGLPYCLQCGVGIAPPNPIHQMAAALFRSGTKCAFPDNAYAPPSASKFGDRLKVPNLVGTEFLVPELTAGLGKTKQGAARMPVPETAVDEHDSVPSLQHQVRFAGKTARVEPVTHTSAPKVLANKHLRGRVLPLDA